MALTGNELVRITGVSTAVPAGAGQDETTTTQAIADLGGGGGGGTPGGSSGQVQYNNAGSFGGITGATTNGTALTLVAPVLGAATATTINKLTLTAPASGSTLTIADGKTFTVSNTMTLQATDGTTINFGAGGTFAYTSADLSVFATGGAIAPASAALGGATIGTDKLAVTGSVTFNTGPVNFVSAPLALSGNISAASWGGVTTAAMTGLRINGITGTMTDTSTANSTTVVQGATDLFGGNTIAATHTAVTYTNYYSSYFKDPVAGSHITFTNAYALGADSLKVNGGASFALGSANNGDVAMYGSQLSWPGNTKLFSNTAGILWLQMADSTHRLFLSSIGVTTAPNLRLGNEPSATPIAQILTVGEVGTGSNTTNAGSTIQGGLATGNATVAPLKFQVGVIQSSGSTAHTYATAVTINNSTATGLQFNGYGAGTITSDGSGNLTAISDPRMKIIQSQFTPGLSALEKIKPIVFKWTPESGMESEHDYAGFDAQNVRDNIDMATWKGRDGLLSLQDRALLAACVNGINELAFRIKG